PARQARGARRRAGARGPIVRAWSARPRRPRPTACPSTRTGRTGRARSRWAGARPAGSSSCSSIPLVRRLTVVARLVAPRQLSPDVVVRPEDVGRVPGSLDPDQPLELVRAVNGRQVRGILEDLVDVASLEAVGLGDRHRRATPVLRAFVVHGILPEALRD